MSEQATIQEQQLVVLAMAEGFLHKCDPDLPVNRNDLYVLWSELTPDDGQEVAQHLVVAAAMFASTMVDAPCGCHYQKVVDDCRTMILSDENGLFIPMDDT